MSYCRFGWDGSDVYVYWGSGGFTCCGCKLEPHGFESEDAKIFIDHLMEHRKAGHHVPQYAIDDIKAEGEENEAKATKTDT